MEYTIQLKNLARNSLRGKWGIAVLVGLVSGFLGAGTVSYAGGGNFGSNIFDIVSELFEKEQPGEPALQLSVLLVGFTTFLSLLGLATLFTSGAARLGYATFNLNLVDGKPVTFSDLFSQFPRFWTGFCMEILVGLYTFLWTLLFIIPGIVKGYSYAMTPYILAEHPEMSVKEAITESRRIMNGERFSLFLLNLSFLGWALLCFLPILALFPLTSLLINTTNSFAVLLCLLPCTIASAIGLMFLTPYEEATRAAFYRQISGFAYTAPKSED